MMTTRNETENAELPNKLVISASASSLSIYKHCVLSLISYSQHSVTVWIVAVT